MTADNPGAEPGGPERADLIRAAARAGFTIGARMIETFRGAQGLIPRPHPAGYRGRTPVWRYPPGTDRQLVALLRWRQHTKDPDLLRVLLWLDGFPIPVSAVRQALARQLQVMTNTIEQAIGQQELRLDLDPADSAADVRAIDALARTAASRRGATAIPRRGRVTADDRARAVSMMLRMFLGQAIEGTAAEAATMERVIGIAPKGRRNAIGDSEPWLTGSAGDLFGLASSIALPNLVKAVADATSADLTAARQTVISLVRYLPILVRLIAALSGDGNYTGLEGISQIDQHPEAVLILVPIVLTMLQAGRSADLDSVTSALRGVPELARPLRSIPDMHIKTLKDNLAGQPKELCERAWRLIEAADGGDFDEHLPFSDTDQI